MTDSNIRSNDLTRSAITEFLDLLPEPIGFVLRLGSIPTTFTLPLLQRMAGDEIDVLGALETLQDYHFLYRGEDDWYYYATDVREIILDSWQQLDQQPIFYKANQAAIEYFEELANGIAPPKNHTFLVEVLYHHLLDNEVHGLEYFATLFEQACDQHQIGSAQDFAVRLTQTLSRLSPTARQYSSYYQIRLNFLLNRRQDVKEKLGMLIAETSDLLLKARAGLLLGQIFQDEYEWKKSAEILKASLADFKSLKAWPYAIRAMLSLGDLYTDLVKCSGGIGGENFRARNKFDRILYVLAYLPHLTLEWLRRKVNFFPNIISFRISYRDWIQHYLLRLAGQWYTRAWKLARTNKDDLAVFHALMGKADVAIQQKRETSAKYTLDKLTELPIVYASPYRQAQLSQHRGQIYLLEGKPIQASNALQIALNTFQVFEDQASVAQVACALGIAHQRSGDDDAAAQAYLESFRAYKAMFDHLLQTQLSWKLKEMQRSKKISNSTHQQIEDILNALRERQYLARFPSEILNKFRQLAYKTVFPIFYFLALLFALVVAAVALIVEIILYALIPGISPLQLGLYFLIIISPIWTMQLLYIFLGHLSVWSIGRKSLDLLGEQPDRIITTDESLTIIQPNAHTSLRFSWDEIQVSISSNISFWKNPTSLFSHHYLEAGDQMLTLDAITNGYLRLKKEIHAKINSNASERSVDLSLLKNSWTFLAVLVAFLHALMMVYLKQIEITVQDPITCDVDYFVLSPILVAFVANLIMLFPPITLWQILRRQLSLARHRKLPFSRFVSKPMFSATIFLSLVAVIWLVIIPVLKLGDTTIDASTECHPTEQTYYLHKSVLDDRMKWGIAPDLKPEKLFLPIPDFFNATQD